MQNTLDTEKLVELLNNPTKYKTTPEYQEARGYIYLECYETIMTKLGKLTQRASNIGDFLDEQLDLIINRLKIDGGLDGYLPEDGNLAEYLTYAKFINLRYQSFISKDDSKLNTSIDNGDDEKIGLKDILKAPKVATNIKIHTIGLKVKNSISKPLLYGGIQLQPHINWQDEPHPTVKDAINKQNTNSFETIEPAHKEAFNINTKELDKRQKTIRKNQETLNSKQKVIIKLHKINYSQITDEQQDKHYQDILDIEESLLKYQRYIEQNDIKILKQKDKMLWSPLEAITVAKIMNVTRNNVDAISKRFMDNKDKFITGTMCKKSLSAVVDNMQMHNTEINHA